IDAQNWITCGNALRLDWLSICPPTGTDVKLYANDLFHTPLDQAQIDFENEGGETYICGNPPYKGNADQNKDQKDDMRACLSNKFSKWKSLDYICGWFYLAQKYCHYTTAKYALVSTNSICQGQNITNFWHEMYKMGAKIDFAVLSFKWANLAQNNAGVTVVIVGGSSGSKPPYRIYENNEIRTVTSINCYLVEGKDVWVEKESKSISNLSEMLKGNYYGLSEGLLMNESDLKKMLLKGVRKEDIKVFKGSDELISGKLRYCLWFPQESDYLKYDIQEVKQRIESVKIKRLASPDSMAIKMAETSHKFREMRIAKNHSIAVPVVSSENREYLPVKIEENTVVFSNAVFALYDAPLWNMAIIASKLHLVWITTVCGQLETRLRYSNTMGWNTFPVPQLTEKNKADLTRCAEDILLAREAHFPATIADLYDPEKMPENLRHAHERNDEVLERIYIGRRFKNDTERLEKLFDMYTKMTSKKGNAQ
ncbi:MAG: type IIL restriction-modification enzyme MmeI, partial [Pseudomonadota bacterium]